MQHVEANEISSDTSALFRYLEAAHSTQWPALKDMREPNRYREMTILPVTGRSPDLFNAT